MLRALTLDGWKSFQRTTTPRPMPFARTTLLVGPNASGKSNVLDALRFLQGCALDIPLYGVLRGRSEGGVTTWPGLRGGDAEAAWIGTEDFTLTSEWLVDSRVRKHVCTVRSRPEARIQGERLAAEDDTPLLHARGLSTAGTPALVVQIPAECANQEHSLDVTRSVMGQLDASLPIPKATIDEVRRIRSCMSNQLHLDLHPGVMRNPAPLQATQMGADGENIAAVLHRMDVATRADLIDWLSELCSPGITDIAFAKVETVGDVYFLLEERASVRVSSRSLSDGTLRFLGILVALMTATPGTTILLEEPDAGLHPARIHLLAQLLEQLPRQRGIQVIASTHSPTLLAHLSTQLLADVLAFDRDPTSGSTLAARVGDLRAFATLRDSKDRASLVATGWLERAR